MKKIVLSAVAALAFSAAPAFAADMPVKAAPAAAPAAAASPFDILFGTAFTTDYELRGISQSNHKPAAQGYFELDYTIADWLKIYGGVWGSSLASYYANAEFDITGGARFSFGNFSLDVGYIYYDYPDGTKGYYNSYGSFGEFYAKPSYKIADWLTIGAIIDGGDNFNNGYLISGSKTAYYYSGNAVITLPWSPAGITISVNPEVGRQVFECDYCHSYTYWDVGVDFNYKAVTLDLRYWDTNAPSYAFVAPSSFGGKNLADSRFVATLKFDTSLSALK
jgi:uncharacterized protein (TIGR02001 family)